MKRNRLGIVLVAGLLVAAVAAGFGLTRSNGTRAEGETPLFTFNYPPTPTVGAAPAGGNSVASASLFSDSFENDTSLAKWEFVDLSFVIPEDRALWGVLDGRLAQRGTVGTRSPKPNPIAAFAGPADQQDYTITAQVYDQYNGTAGLIVRRTGDSFYRFRTTSALYEASPRYALELVQGDKVTMIASAEGTGYPMREWVTLALKVSGSEITASMNGKTVLTATDATLASGQAGIYTLAMDEIFFDNVDVTQP